MSSLFNSLSIKPTYSPHLDSPPANLDCPPAIPDINRFVLESRCESSLNTASSPRCCQFSQMLFNVASALNVSPPLRPALPSSLNSPYIGAEPYIGAWPYVDCGFSFSWASIDFMRALCAPMAPRAEPAKEEIAVCVMECCIVAILYAAIEFAYICVALLACATVVPSADSKEMVKNVVLFMVSLFGVLRYLLL